ncbi:unnamed protein product [Tetraodon nigroviridis]|uniref:(spotted green pufferfish) hypothetical protein n=1 Tax=Tetraodon nigroviridis TaxID=99883 RepID=Q4STN7_TETNG|nr:unnamed protein product [Tetraodon nigroviridis]
MKCTPVIASRKIPRSKWEGKPMLVMKISKRKRCQRCKDTTPNCSPLSSSSTEKEIPADSGLVSEANRLQDHRQSEGSQTNAANETETTKIWASQVNLGEEDSSGTAETNQSSAMEKEENNICGATIQLLPTDDKKWNKRFSMVFSKTSKTEKETKAEMKTETNMTGEAGEKKSKKWFQRIFSSVTSVIPCLVLCCIVPAHRDVS